MNPSNAGKRPVFLRVSLMVVILLWVAAWLLTAAEPATEPADAIEKQFGLKPGPGRELVLGHCIPCHSTAIVAANHLSRKRWDELITVMQTRHGMMPLPMETRKVILDYLEVAQRPEDSGLSGGKQSPWASPLYRPNPLWD